MSDEWKAGVIMATPRGKIGRLSQELRDQLNRMIRDNKTAEEILAFLCAQGIEGVTPQNISTWKRFGYEKWERNQVRIEQMASRRAMAREMIEEARADGDGSLSLASDAASAMAVDALTEVLEDFDPELLKAAIAEKPDRILSLMETLTGIRKRDQDAVVLRQKLEAARKLAEQAATAANASGNRDLAAIAEEMGRVLGA